MKIPLAPGMRVGYLSAAPRVSTRDDAEASGPRSHVLGVIRALEARGATVERFIVGDRMPAAVRARSEKSLRSSTWKTAFADVARIGLGALNARRAWSELGGKVDWVYERAASLQSLGWTFRRRGVPWVLETSSLVFYEAKHDRNALVLADIAKRREMWAYQECDALVCVSRDLRDLLVEAGVSASKIIVVPNGVDTSLYDPDRHRGVARTFPGFTIGFVGSVIAWQGLELLLDAVAAVRKRGLDIFVAIAGDGPDRAARESQTRALEIADSVRFVGRLDGTQVPAFLAGVDLGYSGQTLMRLGKMYHSPLKLYEYMAMERPPIASAFDDAVATIDHAVTGFLFTPGDREALTRAISDAYAARATLTAIGRAARQAILARHSWHTRIDGMLHALGVTLGHGRRA